MDCFGSWPTCRWSQLSTLLVSDALLSNLRDNMNIMATVINEITRTQGTVKTEGMEYLSRNFLFLLTLIYKPLHMLKKH